MSEAAPSGFRVQPDAVLWGAGVFVCLALAIPSARQSGELHWWIGASPAVGGPWALLGGLVALVAVVLAMVMTASTRAESRGSLIHAAGSAGFFGAVLCLGWAAGGSLAGLGAALLLTAAAAAATSEVTQGAPAERAPLRVALAVVAVLLACGAAVRAGGVPSAWGAAVAIVVGAVALGALALGKPTSARTSRRLIGWSVVVLCCATLGAALGSSGGASEIVRRFETVDGARWALLAGAFLLVRSIPQLPPWGLPRGTGQTQTSQGAPRMASPSGNMLDSANGDPECMVGLSTGRGTEAHGPFWFVVAAVLTVATFFGLALIPDHYLYDMMNRCWTNWACAMFAFWALLQLMAKWCKVAIQEKALAVDDIFPKSADWVLSPATAPEVMHRIQTRVARPREFLLFNRIHLSLSNLKNIGEVRDVGAVLDSQAAADASSMDSTYTVLRAMIWVIPVLGFVGTVIGLGQAIGSFSGVLTADAPVLDAAGSVAEAAVDIRSRLSPVVSGLATAFETTLVALVSAIFVQMTMTWLYKKEEHLLDQCTNYCTDHVVARLKLTNW